MSHRLLRRRREVTPLSVNQAWRVLFIDSGKLARYWMQWLHTEATEEQRAAADTYCRLSPGPRGNGPGAPTVVVYLARLAYQLDAGVELETQHFYPPAKAPTALPPAPAYDADIPASYRRAAAAVAQGDPLP